MAIRQKTVVYGFGALSGSLNGVVTNFPSRSIYLPESNKVFRSVYVRLTGTDVTTATGASFGTRAITLQLEGAASYSWINTITMNNSGENRALNFTADFTQYFNQRWTGSESAIALSYAVNISTGTTTGFAIPCATLHITYDYDDTSATQLKTVYIPLNAPRNNLSNGALTTVDTIPALDTYCPENNKSFKDFWVTLEGNTCAAAGGAALPHSLSFQIDSLPISNSSQFPGTLSSDVWVRYHYPLSASLTGWYDTSTTHNLNVGAGGGSGVVRHQHQQIYLTATYTFDSASTSRSLQSVILPADFISPMGSGSGGTNYQTTEREFWIQEPGPIQIKNCAYYAFWDAQAAISALLFKTHTESFVNYFDSASVLCGSNGLMFRNDKLPLARGRNTLRAYATRTDTADLGWGLCGYWMINYTSSVASGGVSTHNRTISHMVVPVRIATPTAENTITASVSGTPYMPTSDYYITAAGLQVFWDSDSTNQPFGLTVLYEKISGSEGEQQWKAGYLDISACDPETGIHNVYSQIRNDFYRYHGDLDDSRIHITTPRRWKFYAAGATILPFLHLNVLLTYHNITYGISGSVTGSGGGEVTLVAHRSDTNNGEKIITGSRIGDGNYTMSWYDNTERVYVEAWEGSTKFGRSGDGYAS